MPRSSEHPLSFKAKMAGGFQIGNYDTLGGGFRQQDFRATTKSAAAMALIAHK